MLTCCSPTLPAPRSPPALHSQRRPQSPTASTVHIISRPRLQVRRSKSNPPSSRPQLDSSQPQQAVSTIPQQYQRQQPLQQQHGNTRAPGTYHFHHSRQQQQQQQQQLQHQAQLQSNWPQHTLPDGPPYIPQFVGGPCCTTPTAWTNGCRSKDPISVEGGGVVMAEGGAMFGGLWMGRMKYGEVAPKQFVHD